MSDIIPAKPINGRYLPGQSGNPAGRPKGAKNKVTLMKLALEGELRTQLGPAMAEVLAVAITKAKQGNESMIKLLVDKTIPTTKAQDDEANESPKINIQIGRLPDRGDEAPIITGEVISNG
jgi:Family of unknown function (DUF5681)